MTIVDSAVFAIRFANYWRPFVNDYMFSGLSEQTVCRLADSTFFATNGGLLNDDM